MGLVRRLLQLIAAGTVTQAVAKRSLRAAARVGLVPFDLLVDIGALDRPAHAYCLWHAADLARRLGHAEISAAEFGVAGGVTLLILERYATEIERRLGVRVHLYGFDTGAGLPVLEGIRDLPYWFRPTQYAMNVELLQRHLTRAKLVLGNVRDTVGSFFDNRRPPLGAIFNDLDLFSSSRDALKIFETKPSNFLPRVFLYLDDVVGGPLEMYGPFNGEIAANEEFNAGHERIKIHLNQNLLGSNLSWRYQIFYAHLFDHPQYGKYIGDDLQDKMETKLRLAFRTRSSI
jgi:hypothetical protein